MMKTTPRPEMGKSVQQRSREDKKVSRAETYAKFALRYIDREIIKSKHYVNDAEAEKAVSKSFAARSSREKADILYQKVMAYIADKKSNTGEVDLDLMREIKVLLDDPETKALALETFAGARIDAGAYKMSELGKKWRDLDKEIKKLEVEFQQVEQALFLKTIKGESKISVAKTKATRLAGQLLELKTQRENLQTLNLENVPHTQENTDAAAAFQLETLRRYRDQFKTGFVWTPSRQQIHTETVTALQNGRWPVLVGEAGTGKSFQANAAAMELTGELPTEVECSATTGEADLIVDIKPDKDDGNRLREVYGPLMRAYTGFEGPWQNEPTHNRGRIVRFDESGRMGDKAFTLIKKARQRKAGDDFYGHPMLPGAAAIWTTNPVGNRYPGRTQVDPSMRREIAEIHVGYLDQSAEKPEGYEVMLAALLDHNDHIEIAEEELAPAYQKETFPDDKKRPLSDGRVVVGEDRLIEDGADVRHGTLWRLANAVKMLQNAFEYGNRTDKDIPQDAPRFKEVTGVVIDPNGGGEQLKLSSTTITVGEIQSWMQGFKDRLEKQDKDFQVKTFSEWIKLKINIYLKQVDRADRQKIRAIFEHFHLFDAPPDLKDAKPITPKKIGYLSPRVPRPLHVEMPVQEAAAEVVGEKDEAEAPKMYEDKTLSLEDGGEVLVRQGGDQILSTKITTELKVNAKTRFTVGEIDYAFAGKVAAGSEKEHQPVGSLLKAGEQGLHAIFTSEQVEKGEIEYTVRTLERDVEELCKMTAG